MSKEEKRNLYEGMYIFNATLSEQARAKAVQALQDEIARRGGEVHKVHDWGRRRLAYEIGGKREGYYFIFFFTLGSQNITELWKDYHLNEDLIRFQTITVEKVQEALEFKTIEE